MTAADAAAVAALHTSSLQGLLSDLGPGLATAFYRAATRVPATVAVVADESGRITGFACGTVEAGGYYRKVATAAPWSVGAKLAWRLLRDPALRAKLGQGQDFTGPELLFLAVDEARRGSGIGGALIRQFEQTLRDRRIDRYALCVESDNARAVAVYEHCGLEMAAEFEEFGLVRRRYAKRIDSDGP